MSLAGPACQTLSLAFHDGGERLTAAAGYGAGQGGSIHVWDGRPRTKQEPR
jgi:hypothetical protein